MTSLHESASGIDALPPDQRAVLQMVLARGQSYDEIARLLSIDRAAVRQRALSALDTLGPTTRVDSQRRALITDYLLGQLPPRVSDEIREHLVQSASERAWARVVASELGPLTSTPLPEIPTGQLEPDNAGDIEAPPMAAPVADREPAAQRWTAEAGEAQPDRHVSRLGGAILLGAVGAAVIAAILIFIVFGVGGGTSHKNTPSAKRATATIPATGTRSTSTTSTSARPLAQINLSSPSHSKAVGVAEVVKAGSATGLVIVAQGLKPNSGGDAYAVWLYNSGSSFYRLGYVKPGVTSNGRMETAGRLPAAAASYKQVVVTLQHGPSTKPGTIVLRGNLAGV